MQQSTSLNPTTIAAIATPPGAGGIGIIRISGPESLAVLKQIFTPTSSSCLFTTHTLYHGKVTLPSDGKILDEVMAVYMQAPRTYTREDVVEIHCHGSYLVLQNVLELLLTYNVHLAEPGEFTKRAFLNGRIDLTRAEAVIDILAAKTRKGVDIAQEQLDGALYRRVNAIRMALAGMRARIEVAIDFPDEDIEIIDTESFLQTLEEDVIAPISGLLECADEGRIFREGVSVVIVGRPNVGKSSLLNALLQEERALVTEIPGTTRDSIEEYLDVMGMPVRIIDTAGIRKNTDMVEELGIKRARQLINKADIVFFMVDGSVELEPADRELFATVSDKKVLILANKMDLVSDKEAVFRADFPETIPILPISAKEQQGID
ncbi:MAG: tRNA uridine-5-carboxymethylaminomethyl(34) synthesis GTPase MnmE, partial [Deltaproteobacteria bacterium]